MILSASSSAEPSALLPALAAAEHTLTPLTLLISGAKDIALHGDWSIRPPAKLLRRR